MSESSHWIVTKVLAGHSIAFNMDTLLTMWLAMGILIIFAILLIFILLIINLIINKNNKKLFKKIK